MKSLSDKRLIECYLDAVNFKLDQNFICLLHEEIKNRNIDIREEEQVLN
ncbi:sporulation histidine kinase inhibitor Sda [Chengkuizengella axinellae]|uniref:Sporulation histidine kinase inhibitor Sda n=1 Tax=Chengkuizengella axinellae TaxID=3064388 RepID=A0ABT9J5C7_9BACL|nr:sporulation histidine kinase inhibitor Sda [Chengkuizengella sp. 2205SS18-9]MDP5276804.1 sporulation histidine kinase inhibitor Sda [Chengkuizengella sp. 2205SS18-9]